jgi:TPR repeat protein
VGEASEPDRISIEFPGATPAEAAIVARECAHALQAAGLDADSIKVARSEQDAMDLGGTLVLLGWAFLQGLAKGTGEAAGKDAWRAAVKGLKHLPEAIRRVLESISHRHRTPVQIQGAAGTWTIGNEFRHALPASDTGVAAGFGTLGIVILGASEFPYMSDPTLNNAAFARSAGLAKSLFSPPNTAFARTEILDLFDSKMPPLDMLDAIERHIDAHPGMHDLLIYYCGHGSFNQDNTYFLLLRTTRAGREMMTGFEPRTFKQLRTRLLDRRVYFVVDACFSGNFVDSLQGDAALDRVVGSKLTIDMPRSGWSVLTASTKDKWAMAPRGEDYTMFTGALAHVITSGTTAAGVRFNLHDLAEEARNYLLRRWQHGAVLPQCVSPVQHDGDVGRLPIFVNRREQTALLDGGNAVAERVLIQKILEEYNDRDADASELVSRAFKFATGTGGLPQDEREAARLYKQAANQGNTLAQNNLGAMYEGGRGGLPKDDREAARLYKLAADQGDMSALNNLGCMYANGRGGLPKNDREAMRLYKLAADRGDAQAQYNLGIMYEKGYGGLPKDDGGAVRLYKLAADQGFASAQYNLGVMYIDGRGGLPKDDREAARLFELAAERYHPTARCNLGWMYMNGRGGLPKDEREAVRHFELAAELGDTAARNNLACMYADGRGGCLRTKGKPSAFTSLLPTWDMRWRRTTSAVCARMAAADFLRTKGKPSAFTSSPPTRVMRRRRTTSVSCMQTASVGCPRTTEKLYAFTSLLPIKAMRRHRTTLALGTQTALVGYLKTTEKPRGFIGLQPTKATR